MRRQSYLLHFNPKLSLNAAGKHVRDGLSTVLRTGDNIWVSCDERTSIERLRLTGTHEFGQHCRYQLADLLDLTNEAEDVEIDIEGMGECGHYLWIIGSHSLKRKQPKPNEEDVAKQIAKLAKVEEEPSRYLLARVPLLLNPETGDYELFKEAPHPTDSTQTLRAAQIRADDTTNDLLDLLAQDPHLKPFMQIPGKDNGFDIEGLAAAPDGRLFVGLRGPVLRGWAIVLELLLREDKHGRLRLDEVPGATEKYYKKHFLDLGGMGLRELRQLGNDMLLLAGPTMDLDGTIAVYCWPDALRQEQDSLIGPDKLQRLFDVPHGSGPTAGQDKAEGMAILDKEHVLIVFDSPSDVRKTQPHCVVADAYRVEQ
ncbi:DUF3616 domain-containing protein [Microvirga sp. STR05]|uniref:DUF3616 domain-containing protein n=1 Tax=Hymenobacter duratus TaxID=2771356 RepID=A0ABR8JFG7_9BACT|nr:DUF3616 domain-containing protein [Hymenobacter duratus]MBD2714145.1 DUF3616 domain-containing protein [Hymenobacter duratus]MBR7949047.1 DUF3616 domain-containing protein [Microvirga sp. STR05]